MYSERSSQELPAIQEPEDKAETAPLSRLVKQWREASQQHEPGRPDAHATNIGKWTTDELATVLSFVRKLSAQSTTSAIRTLARPQFRRVLALTDQEVKEGNLDRVLKRGALLHTDIALLGLGTAVPEKTEDIMGIFADGRLLFSSYNVHWQYARELLACVRRPARDSLVRQWYIATTAHLQSRRDFGYSARNLKQALDLFPEDTRLLFYAGVLHETYASPVSQNHTLPPKWKTSYGTRESELRRAREFLQKAVSSDPQYAEARLHLGRVLGLLGLHPQAAAELRRAALSIKDPQLLYYAWLFLGYEMEIQAQRNEARDCYERAAKLFPTAQSPLMALSLLVGRYQDTHEALSFLQRVFELKVVDRWNDDPWWSYELSHVRNASALIQEMHESFGALLQ